MALLRRCVFKAYLTVSLHGDYWNLERSSSNTVTDFSIRIEFLIGHVKMVLRVVFTARAAVLYSAYYLS